MKIPGPVPNTLSMRSRKHSMFNGLRKNERLLPKQVLYQAELLPDCGVSAVFGRTSQLGRENESATAANRIPGIPEIFPN